MTEQDKPGKLKCPRRLHAKIDRGVIEIHCRSCSTPEATVYHRWDVQTRDRLPDRVERGQQREAA